MLRIAMLSYHTCPLAILGGKDTGGMNVYVRELTRSLGQMGVHVDVFTRSQDDCVPHVLHELGYGNRVVHVPAGREQPLPKKELVKYIPDFVAGIKQFAVSKNIQYDLIHSHYWMSGIAAQSLKEDWGVPMVHMFHTLGVMKNLVARSVSQLEVPGRIEGEREVLRAADRIVIATAAEQEQLVKYYQADENKLVIIPPGVDTGRFYPIPPDEAKEVIGVPKDKCMLLFVGRIEPLKGIDVLIRALALIFNSGTFGPCEHHLAIIGGEPVNNGITDMDKEMQRLQSLCQELGIGSLVVFLGKRSQESLPYYYSAAEFVIMPSYYESFGMVALEAMACGTPVIASQVGGLAYLIEDGKTGYMVPEGDPEALAQTLIKLMQNPGLRQQLSRNAITCARSYDWNVISQRMQKLYEEVCRTAVPSAV
jgi:D-inositol-3-phosphate glycosyltransferase